MPIISYDFIILNHNQISSQIWKLFILKILFFRGGGTNGINVFIVMIIKENTEVFVTCMTRWLTDKILSRIGSMLCCGIVALRIEGKSVYMYMPRSHLHIQPFRKSHVRHYWEIILCDVDISWKLRGPHCYHGCTWQLSISRKRRIYTYTTP